MVMAWYLLIHDSDTQHAYSLLVATATLHNMHQETQIEAHLEKHEYMYVYSYSI